MTRTGRPHLLLLYPSAFNYPAWFERVHIKTSQLLIASYLAQWFPVEYADLEHTIGRPNSPVQIRRFERKVREFFEVREFDILAISCWTSISYRATMTVARIAREVHPKAVIVVGGYHPSARPLEFATPGQVIDYIISGEGEVPLRQIAEGLATTGRPNGTQVINAPTLPTSEFVGIKWELVDDFVKTHIDKPLLNVCIYASRGCPFECSFCMEWLKERGWRPYSPELAADQVNECAARFTLHSVGIADACFGVRPEWRKRFLARMAEHRPDYWVVFETRAEYLDDDDARVLSGMQAQIQIGLESGSPRMLRLMNKTKDPTRYLGHFRRCTRMLSEHGVLHNANLILNHPGETEESLRETFALIDQEIDAGNDSLMWALYGYMDFPGCLIDRDRARYENDHGARFLAQDWWQQDADQFEACSKNEPSWDLRGERAGLWKQMAADRDQRLRDVLTDRAFRFAAQSFFRHWLDDPRYTQS